MNPSEAPDIGKAMSVLVGSFMGLFILAFVLLLALAGLLMPLYVMMISDRVKKMGKLMEKMEWYARRQHEREERRE